ncbi:hypothetical protein, partial [Pseudomonas syringae]|uniref:hypothetical protein n=1 Tax=Pseudomonas syringae TaxID=317 RepID=UPI000577A80D
RAGKISYFENSTLAKALSERILLKSHYKVARKRMMPKDSAHLIDSNLGWKMGLNVIKSLSFQAHE